MRPLASFSLLLCLCLPWEGFAAATPVEVHQVLALSVGTPDKVVALTLDACGGGFDRELIEFLIDRRIPTTIFATKRWLDRNQAGLSMILAHPDLFEVEDHGWRHVPAVIGDDRRVYGIVGHPDVAHLKREISVGAQAVQKATGVGPRWYRAATGEYDPEALETIEAMGYKVAGFSVNADDGATLERRVIVARMQRVKSGDIIIAHMNRPESDTAEGLAASLPQLLERGYRFVKLNDADVRRVPARIPRSKGGKP